MVPFPVTSHFIYYFLEQQIMSDPVKPPIMPPVVWQYSQPLRETMTTADAAKALNRAPQTLRKWACLENGPIRPIRIHGRLAWPVDEIALLLNGNK
jgi:hypothetical protein